MHQGLKFSSAMVALAALLASIGTALLVWIPAAAAPLGSSPSSPPDMWGWAMASAAMATGLSTVAAGYAVAKLGSAAIGALAEKPDLFGRLLIFVGLAEGIAIYGLIVSVLILNRLA